MSRHNLQPTLICTLTRTLYDQFINFAVKYRLLREQLESLPIKFLIVWISKICPFDGVKGP